VFGLVLGFITFWLMRSIDHYQVEVMITLAAVLGGYALAQRLHVSGPLAMVVVGLMIGNHGRDLAMSDTTRHHVDQFWELLDEMLNAVLFVLIGLEVILIDFNPSIWMGAALALGITLLARSLAVGLPVAIAPRAFKLPTGSGKVLVWGGLRGGISVALALSLPPGPVRDTLLPLTYCIVVFSILVQGLTVGKAVKWAIRL
jgi:CPA1 family monovalent cation:H+ antiporter